MLAVLEKRRPVDCTVIASVPVWCDLCTMQGGPGVPGPPGKQVSGLSLVLC